MKRLMTYITATDLIFLFLLMLSGSVGNEAVGDILYMFAFIIPISIGLYLIRRVQRSPHRFWNDENSAKDKEGCPSKRGIALSISASGAKLALPTVLPTIAVTCLISLLTTLVMTALGFENNVNLNGHFALDILIHAVIPAVLEELLFRYIPLKLIGQIGGCMRRAVILSAIMFAFGHANLFQIPYALVAGMLFALIDILCGSILPSVTIHLLNNIISLVMMYGYAEVPFYAVLCALCAVSVVFLILMRKKYLTEIKDILSEPKAELSAIPLAFIIPCAVLAVSALGVA